MEKNTSSPPKPKRMKKSILVVIIMLPLALCAQEPKLYLKAFGGINSTTFVYRTDSVENDFLGGWQAGAGMRVSKRRAFAEVNITYVNYGVSLNINSIDTLSPYILTLRVHTLEVPINIGYIPIHTPVFKWYLYGGLVNKFSLRGRIIFEDETYKYSPSELGFHTYGLAARFGTQVDLAMFNFDFNYTIGITNAIKGRVRTNTHSLQLTVGLLF
jgi:hypothetical protein